MGTLLPFAVTTFTFRFYRMCFIILSLMLMRATGVTAAAAHRGRSGGETDGTETRLPYTFISKIFFL